MACGAVLLGATPSRASVVSLGLDLGGGYWFVNSAQFDFHLRVQFALGKYFAVGFRPGILLNVAPGVEVGAPIDAYFRFHISRVYIDLLGGLAILFGNPAPFRGHAGVGFGVNIIHGLAIGIEGGWLQNGAQLMGRISWHF